MTSFYISPKNFETWAHQNAAEPVDCVEGCLLDSAVYACKRGYAFAYEHYRNAWASDYLVKFIPYKEDDGPAWAAWEAFRTAAEAESA